MSIIKVQSEGINLLEMVSVAMSGNQTISDNTHTLLNYNSVEVDTDSAYDNSASNYKFTVPSGKAGTYLVTVLFNTFNESSSLFHVQGRIYKNGSVVSYQRQRHDSGGSSRHSGAFTNWMGTLAVGDYIQAYGYIDDGNDDAVVLGGSQQSRMTIVRLGN